MTAVKNSGKDQAHLSKLTLKVGRKVSTLTVAFKKAEMSRHNDVWNTEQSKKSDQRLSRALDNLFITLQPHLLYASELHGIDIKLDEELDVKRWFNDFEFENEDAFQGLQVTSVEFIGNGNIDGVKLKGYRTTQLTDKPFKVPLETGVISFDRANENRYKLLFILIPQIEELEQATLAWLERGDTSPVPNAAEEAPYPTV